MTYDSDEKSSERRIINRPVLYTLTVQLLVVMPVFVVILVINQLWATSMLLGAMIYIVPNAYFTHYAYRYRGAQASQQIARSFNRGEFGKLALSATGFAMAYRFVTPLHIPALFVGFCSLIVLQWFIAYQIALRYRR